MAYSQLRELARHFAAGRLPREEYLERRGALLDDMVAGKVRPDYRDIVAPKPSTPPVPIIDVGDDEPEVRRVPIILGAVALVAALSAGGFWFLRLQTAPPPVVVAAQPVAASVTLVNDFLQARDYSATATENFSAAWLALDDEARAAAQANKAWKRLGYALRTEVREQKALVPVDSSGAAAADEARLRAFAESLGIKVD